MAGIDEPTFQFRGKRFCDPFCGVGGFPLEMLNLNEAMRECYRPNSKKKIDLPFVIHGFDKGFERDDERTIILAKANMLIYLAELLFTNPNCTTEFARIFNETFTLFRDNLGTFGHIIKEESNKYDYILTNPPYVTSGSSIIKEEIRKTPRTVNEYPVNALGLEGLSLEWIIKSLKKGGKAFVIIPDGILARVGKKLRNHILSECYLDAIISLPKRTFFANFKHTYIIAITKKNKKGDVQTDPVFTYLVSNIGEQITSIKREEIEDNDLPEMEGAFRMFMGARKNSKTLLERESPRCKIIDITRFEKSSHWVIDRWWTHEERVELGIEESQPSVSKQEVDRILEELNTALEDYNDYRDPLSLDGVTTKEVKLGNTDLFNLFIGKRVLKKETLDSGENGIPVYSANVFEPFGLIEESNITDFAHPSILWGIDGKYELRYIPAKEVFATTDHCGVIQILDKTIIPEYLLYSLIMRKKADSFNRTFRANLTNMKRIKVNIPIDESGGFDVDVQKNCRTFHGVSTEKKTA